MRYDLDILKVISNDIPPACGRILISEPLLPDEYFSRSVVLLAEKVKKSFTGFILNKPTDFKLHDIIEGISNHNINLFIGGPVDRDILYFIHQFDFVSGAIEIMPGLYLGGNVNEIYSLINSYVADNSNLKAFVGCSGWGPGQLEDEILFNSWLVSDVNVDFIFLEKSNLWADALDFVDTRYQIWKNFPVDPDLN